MSNFRRYERILIRDHSSFGTTSILGSDEGRHHAEYLLKFMAIGTSYMIKMKLGRIRTKLIAAENII